MAYTITELPSAEVHSGMDRSIVDELAPRLDGFKRFASEEESVYTCNNAGNHEWYADRAFNSVTQRFPEGETAVEERERALAFMSDPISLTTAEGETLDFEIWGMQPHIAYGYESTSAALRLIGDLEGNFVTLEIRRFDFSNCEKVVGNRFLGFLYRLVEINRINREKDQAVIWKGLEIYDWKDFQELLIVYGNR